MKVIKVIPLITLIIDTSEKTISLTSDDVNITMKGLQFETFSSKFSTLNIKDNHIITNLTGKTNSKLTSAMIMLYNIMYNQQDDIIDKVIKNIKLLIK